MTALAAARATPARVTSARSVKTDYGQKTNTVIWAGAMCGLDASGYVVPYTTATGIKPLGRANVTQDMTGLASGSKTIEVESGIFAWANSSAGDAITIADIGAVVYGVDDNTVAKTDATGTRSAAGIVFDVDADGVWVEMSTAARRS